MSFMSHTINELIAASGFKAADLSRMSGINESVVSRVRQGVQVWVSSETVTAMAEAFAKKIEGQTFQTIHARLLIARLRDECSGPGAKLVQIELLSKSEPSTASAAGKCNREDLVRMQVQLADQLRVQLIVLTGLREPVIMMSYPRRVRLVNDLVNRVTGAKHLRVDDGDDQSITAVGNLRRFSFNGS